MNAKITSGNTNIIKRRKIRVGIDVGGTFTKAVAIDSVSKKILGKVTVHTTHTSKRGVSDGILQALSGILGGEHNIQLDEIDLISHSTTQAINALLEHDTHKVGIIAMGVGPTKGDVIKRTRLTDDTHNLDVSHVFLDTSHLITKDEVRQAVNELRAKGAEVIVVTEAFGVDDPSNEEFVMKVALSEKMPCTASHEISSAYGLEVRTLTAAVNASIMPKTFQVADFVESTMRQAGVTAPLMIMKGDGGVTDMETFRTRPVLTILSGPAASVAGVLLHLRVTNGIFVEVGGTSTNICIIKNGRPEIRYAIIKDHPTCIRSLDVRILGIAGGSMVKIHRKKVERVGPRSAHIAGLQYACFADPTEISMGKIEMIKPKEEDEDRYAAILYIDDKTGKETRYAITNTCAANALGMIDEQDYSRANQESAKIAMKKLGEVMRVSYSEVAMAIIQTASYEITNTITRLLKEYKMESSSTKIVGGGGGATVLAPYVAKMLRMKYEKAQYAEVISSIGVASAMLREEAEVSMVEPTPEKISQIHKKIRRILVAKGAVLESVTVDSTYDSGRGILRVTAIGNVEIEGRGVDDAEYSNNLFTLEEAKQRATEILNIDAHSIDLGFESDHHMVFVGHVTKRRLFSKKDRHRILVLDRYGREKLLVEDGKVFQGGKITIIEELDELIESRHTDIAPQVHLVDDTGMMDFSGLTAASRILGAVQDKLEEGENNRVAVIVEI